jgi:thioredoxin 1
MEVLRFTASWCQPCKALAQQLNELELNEYITVIDIDEQPEIAKQYGVKTVPMLMVMDNNKEVSRLRGLRAKDLLIDWFPKTINNNIVKFNN